MLSKETFCKFIRKFKELDDKEISLNQTLSEYYGEPITTYNNGLGFALDVLIDAMGDTDDLIVSFIYDANYGTREGDNEYYVDGVVYIIDSAEKLYDVLAEHTNA